MPMGLCARVGLISFTAAASQAPVRHLVPSEEPEKGGDTLGQWARCRHKWSTCPGQAVWGWQGEDWRCQGRVQGKGPGEAPGGTRRPASLQSVGKSRPPVPDSRKEGQDVLGQVWSAASYPSTVSGHSGLQTARESHSTLRTLAKAVTKPGDDNHGSRDQHCQLTDSLLEMQGLRPGPRPAESGCRLTRSQGVTCTSQSDKGAAELQPQGSCV